MHQLGQRIYMELGTNKQYDQLNRECHLDNMIREFSGRLKGFRLNEWGSSSLDSIAGKTRKRNKLKGIIVIYHG